MARASLTQLGVEVRTGAIVTAVDEDGVMVPARISAQTPRAGCRASPLATSLGVPLDRAGRVAAEPTLQVAGHPDIFVAGDICAFMQDGRQLPGVAQVAKQQGAHAARNVLRAIRREPLLPFRYVDYGNVATIGRGSAVVDIGPVRASAGLAWVFWLFLHISGSSASATASRSGEWAWSYITFQRRIRLITGSNVTALNARRPRSGILVKHLVRLRGFRVFVVSSL